MSVLSEAVKLEENTGEKFYDIGLDNYFRDMTTKSQDTKPKINGTT